MSHDRDIIPGLGELWAKIDALRARISMARGGEFVGYNDPELDELVGHNYEEAHGASGTQDGFLFGGEIYPSAEAAARANLPPKPGSRDN